MSKKTKQQTKKELLLILELHCDYGLPIVRHEGKFVVFYESSSKLDAEQIKKASMLNGPFSFIAKRLDLK